MRKRRSSNSQQQHVAGCCVLVMGNGKLKIYDCLRLHRNHLAVLLLLTLLLFGDGYACSS